MCLDDLNTEEQIEAMKDLLKETEKMALLGRLLSGITHEINSPLSAIRAASTNLNDAIEKILSGMQELVMDESVGKLSDVFYLIRQCEQEKAEISSKEERELKKKLTEEIVGYGVENEDAQMYVDLLVEMGIREDVSSIVTKMGGNVKKFLSFAYNVNSVRKNNLNIIYAVDQVARLTASIKNYTHTESNKDEMNAHQVSEGIETILQLYNHLLKSNVAIYKNFQPVSPVLCNQDELYQVWTNLIQNALHAMNYQGSLSIDINQESDFVSVAITDCGTGIPLEVQDKVFKPFFTTKPKGQGSGLGLEISRKIIEKHKGTINFTSEPGKTTFHVKLPCIRYEEKQ